MLLEQLHPQVQEFANTVSTFDINNLKRSSSVAPVVEYQGQECVVQKCGNWIEIRTRDTEHIDAQCEQTLEGHSSNVHSVTMSPDGQFIVSGSGDKTIKIWDRQTGQCVKTLDSHSSDVYSVTTSPNGQYIVSASGDKSIIIWSMQTGRCIKILEGHSSAVWSVTVSPDSRRIVSGSDDNSVKVWSMQTGRCIKTLNGHSQWVRSVTISPDGQHIVSGSLDNSIKVWSMQTGQYVKTLNGHSSAVYSVTMSSNSQHIISGSFDNSIKIWDVRTGQCIRTLQGHSHYVYSISMSPNGQHIISGSGDNSIKIWSMQTGQCIETLYEHSEIVHSVTVSPNGQYIVSGSDDNSIKIWTMQTGQCVISFDTGKSNTISIAQWFDGTVISLSQDNQILSVAVTCDTSNISNDLSLLCRELLDGKGIIDRIDSSIPLLSILVLLDNVDLLRSVVNTLSSQCSGTIPADILDARGDYRVSGSTTMYQRPTALHYAIMLGRNKIAQLLLENGASISACQDLEMPNNKSLSLSGPTIEQCTTFHASIK